jgi:6-phosphogluconolactonase (cycloisomerase 2 family)
LLETVATGGLGGITAGSPGDHLSSQGSLTYDPERHLLFAVNAGSDTISVLSVEGRYVRLDQVVSSGGEFPDSIAVHDNVVYVLNAGGSGSVSGFYIFGRYVVPIPGSNRSELLVATKGASNSIDVFQVGPFAYLSTTPTVNADDTNVPFAFATTPSGQLVVAEAAHSTLHTFAFGADGTLTSLSAPVSDGQAAFCWVTAAEGFYYVANFGSNNLSSYTVTADGTPSLVAGVAATTDAGPIDETVSANGKYLYTEAANAGAVDEFQINSDGSLSPIGSVPGLGAGIEGIAAD